MGAQNVHKQNKTLKEFPSKEDLSFERREVFSPFLKNLSKASNFST